MIVMDHKKWLEEVTNGESVRAAAIAAGIPQRTLAGQADKGHISAENVIAIAIAYQTHPVGALVDTDYLDEKWAQSVDPARALREVTEDELADEVLRRMKLGVETGGALDTPIDELAARRAQRAQQEQEDEEELDYSQMLADHSPNEDELREWEEYGGDWTDPNNIP